MTEDRDQEAVRRQDMREPMNQDRKPLRARKTATRATPTTRKIAGRSTSPVRDETPPKSDGAADAASSSRPDAGDDGRSWFGRVRPVPALILALGLAAGGAGVGLAVATEPDTAPDNLAFVNSETTDEVLSLAAAHAQRLVAIDYTELDQYHESLDEFLTPNLVEELDSTWDVLSETYEQTKTVVDAQTLDVGMSFLTEDRAEVLMVVNVSLSRDGVASGSTTGTYLVELSRVDDTWKLSRIPDLPS